MHIDSSHTVLLHSADAWCSIPAPRVGSIPASHVVLGGSVKVLNKAIADIYTVVEPNVTQPATLYDQIPLTAGDRVQVYACGCAQTGGKGKTWKSYLNPKGENSDRLYSGTIGLIYSGETPKPDWWKKPTGLKRIKDFISNQGPGFVIPPGKSGAIILGCQDDAYSDNGYSAHDDGTEDQCKSVGPAAVDVMIYHPEK